MESPTAADFAALEARAAAYDALDKDKLAELRTTFHLTPPAPYDERLQLQNLGPTLEDLHLISAEIDADTNLSPEEQHVLHHELFQRWQASVVGQAGEGFND